MSSWESILQQIARMNLLKKSHLSRRPEDAYREDVYDVIIIGATLSGLTAAAFLSQLGLHVCVIEQSSTCGGIYGKV